MVKTISVSKLKEGMCIAHDIYIQENLIISADTKVKEKMITKLKNYGIRRVFIYEEEKEQEDTYIKQIENSVQFQKFNKEYTKYIDTISIEFNDIIKKSKKIDTNNILKQIDSLTSKNESSFHMLHMLGCIKGYDDSTFSHSVNVALISGILGKWLNFSQEDIRVLSLCGMLHDIGKLMVPHEIITKPGKLTEEEYAEVKKHPLDGFCILKDQEIDKRIKLAALEHHEKCDGTGYPFGKKGDKILAFSKIITIADMYDAMTADRVYRTGMCPFKVINIFEKEGLQKYEIKYILTFLNGIVQTYMNNFVKLNNGEVGQIIMINKNNLSRPLIKTENNFIDLSKTPSLSIAQVL